MSLVADLLTSIRGKRKAKFASKAAEYNSFVGALAKGEEVDIDELAALLDDLDKSDSDLESDINQKQRRYELVGLIESMEAVEKQLPKSETELRKLNEEIDRFLAEKRPRVQALSETVRLMQAEISSKASLQHELAYGNTVPLHLQQVRKELTARRKAWADREREYTDRTQQPKTLARQERSRIDYIDQRLAKADPSERQHLLIDREKAEADYARYQSIVDASAAMKRQLDAELAAIEREERDLSKELMEP